MAVRVVKIGATLLLLAVGSAAADGWRGGIGLASEKVQRGLSQTPDHASLMLDAVHQWDTGWALGLGAASLGDITRHTRSELSASLARHWQLGDDWQAQVAAAHYAYPGSRDLRYREYSEFSTTLGWRDTLSLTALLAPNASGVDVQRQWHRGRVWALELGAHLPLTGRWALDAGLGWQDNQRVGATPYAFGSLGVSWGAGPVQVFVSRVTSRADERGGVPQRFAGDRTVASLWWSF